MLIQAFGLADSWEQRHRRHVLGEMGYTGKQQRIYQGHTGDNARGKWVIEADWETVHKSSKLILGVWDRKGLWGNQARERGLGKLASIFSLS